MSSRSISVKVKVSVLITALRKALAEREERFANNDKMEAEYEKAHDKWRADFSKTIINLVKTGKAKSVRVGETYSYRPNADKSTSLVELVLEVPKSILKDEPQRPAVYAEWEFRKDKEALENAIRVLEMCDSEVVSTSTYHSVVKYL